MRAIVTACIIAVLLALASCAAAPSDSGITGLVTIGPISPVEEPGVVNERPYSATIVVRTESGRKVAEVTSAEDGRFSVNLTPGDYVLEPQSGTTPPYAGPQTITVEAHRFTDVLVSYDSGIR